MLDSTNIDVRRDQHGAGRHRLESFLVGVRQEHDLVTSPAQRDRVRDHLERGLEPAQMLELYPHLTLGQIHSALAYYWDHQGEMDAFLAKEALETEHLLEQHATPLDRAELERRLAAKSAQG